MADLVLVHGAFHGAWCWRYLEPELTALGHEVRTVELPCDDPAATFTTYADVVASAMDGLSDDVVLVGHSLAGLTIPLVPSLRPVGRLVFLCALVAEPGRSFVDQLQREPAMFLPDLFAGTEVDEQGRVRWVDAGVARDILYSDCTDDDALWAFAQLRPQATSGYAEPCALHALPDVDRTSIVCVDDPLVNPAWSRVAARERLGVDAVELPGGHSPFLSRPGLLARVLHEQTRDAAT